MPDDFEEKPASKPDLKVYLALARRRFWYFILPLVLGWVIVFAVSWSLPVAYRSGTLILVEEPTVPQQYVVPNVVSNLQERLDSITQQMLSRTRLLKIITQLKLYPRKRAHSTSDDLVEHMRKDIQIELVRSAGRDQLSAFNVYYKYENPKIAQQVTSELTNLFISENLETRQQQSENTTKFLAAQLEQARQSLSEQEKKLRDYKDRYLGELPGQLQSNLQILSGLQSQLQNEQDALGRAKQQGVYLESLLGQYQALQSTVSAGSSVPVGLPAIDQELDRLRTQLADLSSHYTDRHPDVRKLKEKIAKTERIKAQITADLKTKAGAPQSEGISDTIENGDPRQISPMIEVRSQLKANQIEMTNRQRAIKDLEGEISAYQGRLNSTPVREQQLADITRDYDQSRANYESLLAKKNQSELATNLEKRQQGENFRILDPPGLPSKPYSPNRFRLALTGLFLGLVLGVVSAGVAEYVDDRIYNEAELKKLLSTEVMTEIPPILSSNEEKLRRRENWMMALTAFLVLTMALAGTAFNYLRG